MTKQKRDIIKQILQKHRGSSEKLEKLERELPGLSLKQLKRIAIIFFAFTEVLESRQRAADVLANREHAAQEQRRLFELSAVEAKKIRRNNRRIAAKGQKQ